VLLVIISFSLFSQTQAKPEEIESRLARTEGKEKIPLLADLAKAYQLNDPKKSLKCSRQALELLKTFPDKKSEADILNSMCGAHFQLGEYQIAMHYAQKSLSIAEQINDKPGMAKSRNYLADVSVFLGEYDRALDYYSKSLETYKDLNDKAKIARIYNLIGMTYGSLSEYPNMLAYLFRALKIYEELGDQDGIAEITNSLGFVYWKLGDADKSLKYYLKSLKIEKERNNKLGIAFSYSNIGVYYTDKGEYKKSMEYFENALKISEEIGNKTNIATIYNNIGEIHRALKNDRLALDYFDRAVKIKEELKEKRGISRYLINATAMNRRLGRHQISLEQAERALAIAKEINAKAEIMDGHLEVSLTFETMGNHKKALAHYKKYQEEKESIFNEKNSRKIARLENQFELEKGEKEIALLKKDQEIQRSITIFLIIFSGLILLMAFLIYTRYRLKARISRKLEREINERKRTEGKLRESKEKFRVLAEKSVVGICIVQDNTIKYANPRLSEIFGCPPEEIIGKNPLELVVEEDVPQVTENLAKRMAGSDDAISYEFRGHTKTGDIIDIESHGSLTQYDGEPALLETIIDVTDRKKAEMEILKIRKLESVGILAGGIAHDFNNLLTVIIGNISLARSNLERQILPIS